MTYVDISRNIARQRDRRRYILLCVLAGTSAAATGVHAYLHFTGQLDPDALRKEVRKWDTWFFDSINKWW
eukprot:m.20464 g.20464  ORF g.20464 m.20464 type:complete len:70 (+) comp3535_c0_seq1:1109-1318(+)